VTTADLRLDEANELLAAWVCAQAARRGIRALVIKGRTLADDGLRAPRVSSDVDLIVEPARFDEYCDAIVDAGWQEFPSTFASAHFTLHSRTFRKQGWPNSLDVHSEYPGFLRGPDVVFDALWDSRRDARFASQPGNVPSRPANAMILALHSLRGTHLQERHRDELEELERVTFTDDERGEIAALTDATGAAAPLRDVLAAWGVTVRVDEALAGSAREREWRRKTAEAQGAAASWLSLLRTARWRDKPEVVWRAFWPSRADFRTNHPEIPDRLVPQVRGRLVRWGRGLRRAPAAVRALRRR
jgi:hypothetical protein